MDGGTRARLHVRVLQTDHVEDRVRPVLVVLVVQCRAQLREMGILWGILGNCHKQQIAQSGRKVRVLGPTVANLVRLGVAFRAQALGRVRAAECEEVSCFGGRFGMHEVWSAACSTGTVVDLARRGVCSGAVGRGHCAERRVCELACGGRGGERAEKRLQSCRVMITRVPPVPAKSVLYW